MSATDEDRESLMKRIDDAYLTCEDDEMAKVLLAALIYIRVET